MSFHMNTAARRGLCGLLIVGCLTSVVAAAPPVGATSAFPTVSDTPTPSSAPATPATGLPGPGLTSPASPLPIPSTVAQAEAAVVELSGQMSLLRVNLGQIQAAIAAHTQTIDVAQAKARDLKTSLARVVKDLKVARKSASAAKAELAKAATARDAAAASREQGVAAATQARADWDAARSNLAAATDEVNRTSSALSGAQSGLTSRHYGSGPYRSAFVRWQNYAVAAKAAQARAAIAREHEADLSLGYTAVQAQADAATLEWSQTDSVYAAAESASRAAAGRVVPLRRAAADQSAQMAATAVELAAAKGQLAAAQTRQVAGQAQLLELEAALARARGVVEAQRPILAEPVGPISLGAWLAALLGLVGLALGFVLLLRRRRRAARPRQLMVRRIEVPTADVGDRHDADRHATVADAAVPPAQNGPESGRHGVSLP